MTELQAFCRQVEERARTIKSGLVQVDFASAFPPRDVHGVRTLMYRSEDRSLYKALQEMRIVVAALRAEHKALGGLGFNLDLALVSFETLLQQTSVRAPLPSAMPPAPLSQAPPAQDDEEEKVSGSGSEQPRAPTEAVVEVQSTMMIAFALVHVCVRNDDHCPVCKRYTVRFFPDWGAAYAAAKELIGDDDKEEELGILKGASRCWIDEWVRRRNGDSYLICPVADGTRWALDDVGSVTTGDKPSEPLVCVNEAKYLGLSIRVERQVYCPENLRYRVTLHHTAEAAAQSLREAYQAATYDWRTEDEEERHDEDEAGHSATEKRLAELESLWLADAEKGVCFHLQVVPISREAGAEMKLHEYCPQIQPEAWHKMA
jgi:hypothetical protein